MSKKTPRQQIKTFFAQSTQWLIPGLGVKRWVFVLFLGITLIAVGTAFFVLDVYRSASAPWWVPILSALSLQSLSRPLRILIFGGIGLGILGWGIWGLNRSLMAPFVQPGQQVVNTIARHRRKGKGPRIVAIGGGTGLFTLLRGLKAYTRNVSAVVTVADDGGSSGRLRHSLGTLPPGDIRNCLAALSDEEDLINQLFRYRFANGSGLDGHSFGNLFISALTEITGSFEKAIAASGRVLSVDGRVYPSTLQDVRLVADVVLPHAVQEVRVEGESQIPEAAGNICRVWLDPINPSANPQAIQVILGAGMIVIGPGSLYTSILPNLLVTDIANAIRASRGLKILICNVATQPGETHGYTCGDHLRAIEDHLGSGIFDIVLCNDYMEGRLPDGVQWVIGEKDLEAEYFVYRTDVVDHEHPWRHNSEKLAQVLIDLLQERTGPLVV